MQIEIIIEPEQEAAFELSEVLRKFAADYESWMIRSVKSGKHTLHDEGGELVASLEIVKGAKMERDAASAESLLNLRFGGGAKRLEGGLSDLAPPPSPPRG